MPAHPPLGRPVFAPADRIPALAALRECLHRQDWDAVTAAYQALPDENDRAVACRALSRSGSDVFLNRVAAADPRDPLVRSWQADRLIHAGWAVRTAHRAQHVTHQQFTDFHAHLRRAELLLMDVCAEHPEFALAWYLRIITARGLELGPGETRRRYDRLAEHHPHHFSGQQQLLQQLCPKWGGTWEDAHGFAEECAKASPPGSPNGALVATAQMEQYLEMSEKGGTRPAETYLRQPDTHARLREAAEHSVLHPDSRSDAYAAVSAHSAFAAVHCAAGRHAEAAPHFRALGDHADDSLWGYFGSYDPEAEFVRHRKTALRKG
ncbi:hypothetical protein [Streptomyces sp. NPDC088762]|uniref:hypothetical protein n=1 Tax=Streptomyces sp. NPDC088762 TaxID=3365891 RepID=UPI0037F6C915